MYMKSSDAKPLIAVWNFLLKLAFFSFYVNVQLFHFNSNENSLIKVKLHRSLIKMLILEENVKRHLEAFASELSRSLSLSLSLSIYIYIYIYIQSWSELLAPLVNMIKEGCEN